MPALDLLYGIYTNRVTPGAASPQDIRDASSYIGWVVTIVGVGEFLLAWLFLACFTTASHDLTQRLRHTYVASVLAQDASHFDLHGAGEIANRASKDIAVIRAGFGEKLAYASWSGATLVVSAIIGFIKAPRIAGVLFALLPLTMIIFSVLGKATEIVGAPALRIEGRSSTFLEQVLGSVRVVQSFGMESQLLKRFDKAMLKPLEKLGMRKSAIRASKPAPSTLCSTAPTRSPSGGDPSTSPRAGCSSATSSPPSGTTSTHSSPSPTSYPTHRRHL